MKHKHTLLIMVIGLMALISCKTMPPVNPENANSSAAVVTVKLEKALSIFGDEAPEIVYLTKVDEKNLAALQPSVIPSSYVNGDRFYFLNLSPGKYAIVAALFTQTIKNTVNQNMTITNTNTFTTAFEKDLIQETVFVVEQGKLAMPGLFSAKMVTLPDNIDAVPKHYGNLIAPGDFSKSEKGGVIGFLANAGKKGYLGVKKSVDRSEAAVQGLLTAAREDFKKTTWEGILPK